MDKVKIKDFIKKLKDPEQLIKDNKIEFKFGDKMYRIRLPEYKDKIVAEEARDERYMELLNKTDSSGNPLFRRRVELIELYKKQGIDIVEFDNEFTRLGEIINKKQIELNSLTKQDEKAEDKDKIKSIKQQIQVLQLKQLYALNEKTELLRYCIEDKCESYYLFVLTVRCTEVSTGNKWKQLYKDVADMNEGKEELNNRISYCSGYLFVNGERESEME